MQDKLIEYAKVIVSIGVNIQKGQTLVVSCPIECADFGRMIAEEAYNAGAREVVMRWGDDLLTRMRFLKADNSVFDEIANWLKTFVYEYADKKAALVNIAASDPEYLKGVDPDRLKRNAIATGKELKEFQNRMTRNEFPWCVVSVPTKAWASKVFPGVSQEQAMEKLWDAILTAVRVDGTGKAVENWKQHVERLHKRVGIMDGHNFAKLIFKNSLGTDLTVEIPEKHKWVGVGDKASTGVTFLANMPSEEIFTLPKKDGVNGVICSSIPLALDGTLVKDIRFTVKDGKIIEATASEGLEVLQKKLDVDEGARHFGEVALVPHSSPISNMGILFYNTLFDENASCHFAFGKAYPAFVDTDSISDEELKKRGANDSFVHVDFMIGTKDMKITGITRDGKEVPVFINGDFAF
ncbi:MAG: aminopeptidase [Treponema sp.]|nr:aminopeptidase [Treponema sp.]